MKFGEKNPLIVFYSRTRNTAIIADMIKQVTKGDIFEIKPLESYPRNYQETTKVAKQELNNNARPKFDGSVSNIDRYDTIFLGYPNWWGTMPMVVYTFLESYDLNGKKIIPFCTHGGGGFSRSINNIKKLCPNSNIIGAKAFLGSSAKDQKQSIEKWIQNLK
jgi:flavodoxin